ncbi:Serine/threonine-protein kinase Nek7 [Pseudocercospora fuligena]|uniref:non-specific serine/threonine protein kinase n=1 Tax=Pseudocercospora fuligena TaxID=685502 RepID=A0A8H6RDT8_9PEZI|nr:Serine/threonine-protein kinase Nek7 [Pseudocercospora fuligena]
MEWEPPPGLLIEADVEAREAQFDQRWAQVIESFVAAGYEDPWNLRLLEQYRRALKTFAKYHRSFDIPLRTTSENSRAYLRRLAAVEEGERQASRRVAQSRYRPPLSSVEQEWGTEVADKIRGTEFDAKDVRRAIWETINERFSAAAPSPEIASRFANLYTQLMDNLNSIREPRWYCMEDPAKMTGEQVCDEMELDLKLISINKVWNTELDRLLYKKDRAVRQKHLEAFQKALDDFDKNYRQMRRDVYYGLEPYGPHLPALGRDTAFMKLRVKKDVPGQWKWRACLGEGGGGFASVWLRFDDKGNMIDRMAVKEVLLGENKTQWNDCFFWEGDMAKRIPREHAIAEHVTRSSDSTTIVKPIAYGVYPKYRIIRLYSEYCNLNSLKVLVELYRRHNGDMRRKHGKDVFVPIPERALWSLFECLASALCFMHQGALPKDKRAADHHDVLHRDLKPPNIFRSTHTGSDWPGVPTAKVGDFGCSTWLDHEGAKHTMLGTPGWFAPECHTYDRKDFRVRSEMGTGWNPEPYKNRFSITNASDVWSVGRTLRYAMLQEDDELEAGVLFETQSAQLKFGPNQFSNNAILKPAKARRCYPEKMCELVERCLEQFPEDRIGVNELWAEVQKVVTSSIDEDGGTLKTSAQTRKEMWIEQVDKYLGMATEGDSDYEGSESETSESEKSTSIYV